MQTYSFLSMVVLVNDVEITGWKDGDDVITATRNTESATHRMGADGKMVVSLGTDFSGSFTFNLDQTSPSNKFLNQLLRQQENGPDTFVPVRVRAQDTYRQDLAEGSIGYLTKAPDFTRGIKTNTQTWVIQTENLSMLFGDVGAT